MVYKFQKRNGVLTKLIECQHLLKILSNVAILLHFISRFMKIESNQRGRRQDTQRQLVLASTTSEKSWIPHFYDFFTARTLHINAVWLEAFKNYSLISITVQKYSSKKDQQSQASHITSNDLFKRMLHWN